MASPITLLGAGGAIANETAKSLGAAGYSLRLVSRNPKAVHASDELFSADLLDAAAVQQAVAGSAAVALVAGFPYKTSVWKTTWPVVIRNVIAACQAENAKLLFFDNVYALGAVAGAMSEQTPIKPNSHKGQVRAEVVQQVLAAQQKGLQTIIARAPDFYGPKGTLGTPNFLVFDKFAAGKKPSLLGSDSVDHTYIYTPDAGRAVAKLLTTDAAWNQIWNLPVDPSPITGAEFVRLAAQAFGAKPVYSILPKLMVRIGGLFDTNVREMVEMMYQYDRPYTFDSSKFAAAIPDFHPTSYAEGLAAVAASYR